MRTYNNPKDFMKLLINVSIYVKLPWLKIICDRKKILPFQLKLTYYRTKKFKAVLQKRYSATNITYIIQ